MGFIAVMVGALESLLCLDRSRPYIDFAGLFPSVVGLCRL